MMPQLVFDPVWPWSSRGGMVGLSFVALLLSLLTIWTYRAALDKHGRRVGLLVLLRLAALVVACLFLLRPSLATPDAAKNPSAARFVRRIRKEVRSTVASFTDSYQYTIDQLIERIIDRCRELNLRLTDSEESTKTDFIVFLTVQTMNYLHSGRHRVAL